MKRKRKETCPSPILDDSPKRTKVQAQRKFAQNSGVHSPIITPIRDLEAAEHPHTSVLPEPVELLPMKRPNTEDFLTFLCFRGTPILPPNLQFFNTASIVADGQVHEIKGDCPKNGPIDIAKCAGSSSDKPFIAFGVRKRADPIVISRQMDRKRRHALAIQALRRKYQEQKMAKIRALTISKLSEKTTNKTMVKTNTIQKTETVTKKTNTLQKTKVIATKHVKVTTQTLKTKVKPKMCLRSFQGKFVQKELPFRPRSHLTTKETITTKRPVMKPMVRTSRNSNKSENDLLLNRPIRMKKPLTISSKTRVTRSESVTNSSAAMKRPQIKRRILLPTATIVTTIVKPKLRSTTTKKTVISRRKAQQRLRASINRSRSMESSCSKESPNAKNLAEPVKKEAVKKVLQEKGSGAKKQASEGAMKKPVVQLESLPDVSRRLTRKDSGLAKEKSMDKKEITKNVEVKKEVKIAETGVKKMVKKNVNLKREFNLKSNTKDVKKNVALQKTSDTVSEKHETGQRVTRDVKTMEMTVKKVVTRKSEETKSSNEKAASATKEKTPKSEEAKTSNKEKVAGAKDKKPINPKEKSAVPAESTPPNDEAPKESPKKILRASTVKASVAVESASGSKPSPNKIEVKKTHPSSTEAEDNTPRRVTRDSNRVAKEAPQIVKQPNSPKKLKETKKDQVSPTRKTDQEFSRKIKELIDNALKDVETNTPLDEPPKQDEANKDTTALVVEAPEPPIKEEIDRVEPSKEEPTSAVINSGLEEALTIPEESTSIQKKPALPTKKNASPEESAENKSVLPPTKSLAPEEAAASQKKLALTLKKTPPPEEPTESSHKKPAPEPKKTPPPEEASSQKKLKKSPVLEESTSSQNKPALVVKKTMAAEEPTSPQKKSAIALKKTSPLEEVASLPKKPVLAAKKVACQEDPAPAQKKPTLVAKKTSSPEESACSQKKPALVPKKSPPAPTKKIEKDIKKEESNNPRRKLKREESDNVATVASSRPTRKTKEAAAIYMELLSHKLVNESPMDDDVSIDSFPELPNVKRTEQMEIELKAQAQTSKDEVKSAKNVVTPEKPKKEAAAEDKFNALLGKRKSSMEETDDDSDNEVLQVKISKFEAQKQDSKDVVVVVQEEVKNPPAKEEEELPKRQTRRSTQPNKESDNDSSDESFHIDVRVPKRKKATRSRTKTISNPLSSVSVLEKNVDIILEAARVLEAEKPLVVTEVTEVVTATTTTTTVATVETTKLKIEPEASDSDESTTSDINLKSLQARQKTKKLTKTKGSKSSAVFSDSDEEPLAKLTIKSGNGSEEPKKKKVQPVKKADKSVPIMEPKPKRECTKRPGNYLPMLSSSDEDDEPYFHGFNTSKEELDKPKVFVQTLAPSLDLLSKDIGRKGKVNMSKEEIEQWLKDSALAGSSVAKENDAMLKFGEKIPTEVPKSEPILPAIVPDLKPPELEDDNIIKPKVINAEPDCSKAVESKPKMEIKSPLTADRKWIFKKDKKDLLPNKNAFSPENECSVYAFGEETDEVVNTPFRRPSRRPSSTATSRSEDDLSKNEDSLKQGRFRKPNPSDSEDSRCFNIPQNPAKLTKSNMVPPSSSFHSKRQTKLALDKFPEPFDDYKYKVPSSPSASSGSSTKLYKKGTQKAKCKAWESINPVYVSDFPKPTDPAKLVEAPVFHPTDQEFQDPLEYIERIRHKAEQFGVCKIVPPSSFKPECKVSDDMRFTAYNQYVHKMLHRWGPNFKEFIAIKKYLATQSIFLKTPPLIGGMEIDLPRLYQTVQSLGGLKDVIEKKKWSKVSDQMKIPKSAQDRVTKLDDIYCKYLLPYETLSPAEREKLFDEVETYWAKKESRTLQERTDPKLMIGKQEESSEQDFDSDDNDNEECTVKGKNMALNSFYRVARNTMSMYFKVTEPTALEVEQEFWRYVTQKQNHICVHSASIDCGTWGYGFPVSKNSPFARHPWNLKVLSNNNGSVLRSLGPVMGVTIPTLHVGMVFSACCWYRDPHGLPWVEYLHTGGNKIWYGIPSSSCELFHTAMQRLVPNYCRDKELWLPSDTAMVPPGMLIDYNVSLCRTIQEPGQFIVVFPKVFTSSISTGYVVSESVYFAPLHWLKTARNLFSDLKTSCEPSMFSLNKLLISISSDHRSSLDVLRVVQPFIEELCASEKEMRRKLRSMGQFEEERLTVSEPASKKKKIQSVDGDFECEVCRMNLFASMVVDTQEDLIYCLEDAVKLAENNLKMVEKFKLKYNLDEADLENAPKRLSTMIEAKMQKKAPHSKFSGMPTLLK